ncbi:MAG TPA: hypothetical protein P5262_04225 [Candidatus Moranbacteria bacterium]|nr:hypothetical protein [Candidatus Moranbacteria bacterium]
MKNKIKSIVSFAFVLALSLPVAAGAQFGIPAGTGVPEGSVTEIIISVTQWLLYIVGFLGIIGFAIAGILYLTAAGDDDRITKAKNAMLYSIIGVIVAIAGVVALRFAANLLSAGNRL